MSKKKLKKLKILAKKKLMIALILLLLGTLIGLLVYFLLKSTKPYPLANIVGLNIYDVNKAWKYVKKNFPQVNGFMGWACNLYFIDYGPQGQLKGTSCGQTYPTGLPPRLPPTRLTGDNQNYPSSKTFPYWKPRVPRNWGNSPIWPANDPRPNDIIVYYNTSGSACDWPISTSAKSTSGTSANAPSCSQTNSCGGNENTIPCGGNAYIFSPEEFSNSGYTMVCDAFWVNYPFCWAHGKQNADVHPTLNPEWKQSRVGSCKSSPALQKRKRWNVVPGVAGIATNCDLAPLTKKLLTKQTTKVKLEDYSSNTMLNKITTHADSWDTVNQFYQSLHQPYLLTSIYISQSIKQCNKRYKKDIKFIASIGGWNMGATKAGQAFSTDYPDTAQSPNNDIAWPPDVPPIANWQTCLYNPTTFAQNVLTIMKLRLPFFTEQISWPTPNIDLKSDLYMYDGFDIDCESQFAGGTVAQTVEKFVSFYSEFISLAREGKRKIILLAAPRVADVLCKKDRCVSWFANGAPTYKGNKGNIYMLGFFGQILKKLAEKEYYLDHINIQCYNDMGTNSFPNVRGTHISAASGGHTIYPAKDFPLSSNSDIPEILDIMFNQLNIFNKPQKTSKTGGGPTKLNLGVLMQGGTYADHYSTWIDDGNCQKLMYN